MVFWTPWEIRVRKLSFYLYYPFSQGILSFPSQVSVCNTSLFTWFVMSRMDIIEKAVLFRLSYTGLPLILKWWVSSCVTTVTLKALYISPVDNLEHRQIIVVYFVALRIVIPYVNRRWSYTWETVKKYLIIWAPGLTLLYCNQDKLQTVRPTWFQPRFQSAGIAWKAEHSGYWLCSWLTTASVTSTGVSIIYDRLSWNIGVKDIFQ